jgi:hypothetical protein
MAGSFKIQHGTTPSTPQAGYSTLWVSSADGEFYFKKPNGTVESLVGPTGSAGAQGPTGSVGATGVGLGLNAKNIGITGGQFTYVSGVNDYSYADITFSQPFLTTNYSVDFQYTSVTQFDYWSDFFGALSTIRITNKTASGFRLEIVNINIPAFYSDLQGYVQCIALGETAVSNYGNFYSTVSQPNAGATAANAITYNTTDLTRGVSVVSSSRITIANPGIYNIEFSLQLQKSSGGDDQVDIWLAKNGNNVANSNTTIMLHSNPGYEVAAWNFLVQANAGDYYELYWHSADTTAQIHAAVAGTNPTRPAIPSVILSVTQISAA